MEILRNDSASLYHNNITTKPATENLHDNYINVNLCKLGHVTKGIMFSECASYWPTNVHTFIPIVHKYCLSPILTYPGTPSMNMFTFGI